jgi:hypothetical protein
MLEINERHLETFERIKALYLSKTEIPQENNWRSLLNNDIWLNIVAQVMVVGGSKPFEKFDNSDNLKKQIAFETLLKIEDQISLKKTINQVLRAVGTRYVSKNLQKCAKTKALAHNFNLLRSFSARARARAKAVFSLKTIRGICLTKRSQTNFRNLQAELKLYQN